MFWVFIRSASLRPFLCVPTPSAFVEKEENYQQVLIEKNSLARATPYLPLTIHPANTQRLIIVVKPRCNVTTLQQHCNHVVCLLGWSYNFNKHFYYLFDAFKTAGWVTNSANHDQMLHSATSDLGLCCLLKPVCPNTYGYYGNWSN